jgi:hypothetical protein
MHFIPVTSLEPAIFHHTAWLHHHFLIRSVYRAIAPTGISSGDSSAETQPFRSRVYPDDNEKAPTAAREIAIAISTSSQLTHHQRRAARGGLKASQESIFNEFAPNLSPSSHLCLAKQKSYAHADFQEQIARSHSIAYSTPHKDAASFERCPSLSSHITSRSLQSQL